MDSPGVTGQAVPQVPLQETLNPPEKIAAHRGRAARDPLEVTATYDCASLDDFKLNLRRFLDQPPTVPEHAAGEFKFWIGASFVVTLPNIPAQPEQTNGDVPLNRHGAPSAKHLGPNTYRGAEPTTIAALSVLEPSLPLKEKIRTQKAIARTVVEAISRVDGFRYTFQNDWLSRDDAAYRFSFYCNDSLLNKDRAANGKSRRRDQGKRAIKPVYDCKGALSVKFSCTRQSLEVLYKHNPIHETYEARAPPPRKDAKRRAEWEAAHPDRVQSAANPSAQAEKRSAGEKNLKRKAERAAERAEKKRQSEFSAESDLLRESQRSLLELIQPDVHQEQPGSEAAPIELDTSGSSNKTRRCDQCTIHGDSCENQRPRCRACVRNSRSCTYDEISTQPSAPSAQQTQQPARPTEAELARVNDQLSTTLRMHLDKARTEIRSLKGKLRYAEDRIRALEWERGYRQDAAQQQYQSHQSHQSPVIIDTPSDTPIDQGDQNGPVTTSTEEPTPQQDPDARLAQGLQQLAQHVQQENERQQQYPATAVQTQGKPHAIHGMPMNDSPPPSAQQQPSTYQSSISRSAWAHDQRQFNNSPQYHNHGLPGSQASAPQPSFPPQGYSWPSSYSNNRPPQNPSADFPAPQPMQFGGFNSNPWRPATMPPAAR